MKNRKPIIIMLPLLIIVVIVSSVLVNRNNAREELKASVTVSMRDLTKVEYYTYTDKENKDLRKITIQANITNAPKQLPKNISIPYLNELNQLDNRLYNMQYWEDDPTALDHTSAIREYVMDCTNLKVDDIKKLFSHSNVTINATTKSNQKINYTYNIGDLLTYTPESGS